jgi:hypothetical protein
MDFLVPVNRSYQMPDLMDFGWHRFEGTNDGPTAMALSRAFRVPFGVPDRTEHEVHPIVGESLSTSSKIGFGFDKRRFSFVFGRGPS